jgi:hypothetical protein
MADVTPDEKPWVVEVQVDGTDWVMLAQANNLTADGAHAAIQDMLDQLPSVGVTGPRLVAGEVTPGAWT